ncbi:uncharacterized protein LOC126981444 isoform X2 [Eriocheir sinensis]|nr:uncharacterized protein LOC126981444 isoform X2 [Eriocheir sinensis]
MKKKNGNKLDVSLRTMGESGETSVMKQDDHEPASCGQNKTLAQTFFVVDVPFTCLRALNITSNKVMVLVDTLPGACLMSWSEEGWTSLPWSHPVGLACHARLTLFRALLAVSPMHQLCLQDGKDQAMQESLSRFSPWFKQTLSRPFPVQSEFAPSWALPFPAIPADLSSTTCTVSSSSLSPPSSSLSSITSLSPFLSSTFEDAVPQYTAFSTLPGVSAPNSNSPNPQSTPSSEVQGGAQHVQKPKGRVHSEQTTKPGLTDAGPAAALPAVSSEPYIVSSVRAVLQAQGFTHVLPTKQPLQYPPNLCLEKGCSCRGMCRTMECPCARAGVLCHPNQSCCCENCDNPLNVLHVMGIDVQAARQDECLMQNLYNYNVGGLCSVLVSRVRLPCCGASPELLKVIPGTVTCSWCAAPVSYSWCSHYVHLQTLCPRSHCMECFRCKPVMNTHCQTCHVCTKTHEGKCAECGLNKF